MSTPNESFSIELNHPFDKEAWKVVEDAELENTEHMYFTTPGGKRVEFIKADVFDKIRGDIEEYKSRQLALAMGVEDLERGKQIALEHVLSILDEYKAESEEA